MLLCKDSYTFGLSSHKSDRNTNILLWLEASSSKAFIFSWKKTCKKCVKTLFKREERVTLMLKNFE